MPLMTEAEFKQHAADVARIQGEICLKQEELQHLIHQMQTQLVSYVRWGLR